MQQYDYTKGKNATDVALTIDAMDLSYTDNIKIFAIVSSDCDFTPLVMRLRERGLIVYGFGESKTPKAFARACSDFFCLSTKSTVAKKLVERSATPVTLQITPEPTSSKTTISEDTPKKPSPKNTKLAASNTSGSGQISGDKLKQNTSLIKTLRQVITENQDKDGWSSLAPIGIQAKIQPKQYGYSKLSSLLKAIDLFEVKQHKKNLMVRCKSSR